MIDRIIAFAVRHRWQVFLAGALVVVLGIRAVHNLPVDAIPDLSENQVIVYSEWPGHGPREIEDQVSYPLSLELKGLDGVRVVRAVSDVGYSSVSVIFKDGVDAGDARRRVGEMLSQGNLPMPAGVTPRLGPDGAATGQIFWYTVEGTGLDAGRLRAIQDWYVKPQLSAVPGVAEVASVGGPVLEYQVELDPHRLRARGISANQVADAIHRANTAVGGDVIHKGNAEYVVHGAGWLGSRPSEADADFNSKRVIGDLRNITVNAADGTAVPLSELGHVGLGGRSHRGIFEHDGSEVAGGVVLMRRGENPLEVIRRVRAKILDIEPGLPPGVRIIPVYDRTPLIRNVIGTVSATLVEAILVAAICILVVLRHVRTALMIALTLPIAVLCSFVISDLLRRLGVADVQTNLMSLAGLAVSVGVLVDAGIVMADNVMHRLKRRTGDAPVRGDTRADVLAACQQVGRPLFFSILIMLISFLPVFALSGMEGKMFHPFAFTKSFALVGVALLAVTLVPAMCTVFVRGRLRSEEEVGLVRGLMRVYRPVLGWLLDRPIAIVWFVGLAFVLGAAAYGNKSFLGGMVAAGVMACAWAANRWTTKLVAVSSLTLVGLLAGQLMKPLKREEMTPLDEGMVMDMPISWPRMSATQAADDLKARDMIFGRFPEVDMVVGKAGRAETATDPAPLDMIETMINFRPREFWPRRVLQPADAERQVRAVLDALAARHLIQAPPDMASRDELANQVAMDAMPNFDAQMREAAYQRNKEFERDLGRRLGRFAVERFVAILDENGSLTRPAGETGLAPLVEALTARHVGHLAMQPAPEAVASLARDALRKLTELGAVAPGGDALRSRRSLARRGIDTVHHLLGGEEATLIDELFDEVRKEHRSRWREHVDRLNADLRPRGAGIYTRLVLEAILMRATIVDERARQAMADWHRVRTAADSPHRKNDAVGAHHQHGASHEPLTFLEPVPELNAVQSELTERFARDLLLWPRERAELIGFGGELDRVMQMPGWTNVWTTPIQNRVDMLYTGVNTAVGVRVLGRRLEDVVRASEEIAKALKQVPGAADVIADPVRGKSYLEIIPDRAKARSLGVDVGDVMAVTEIAMGGQIVTTTIEGRERHPVRVRFARSFREDEESARDLPIPVRRPGGPAFVFLSEVATVRITDGPAAIRSEDGLLRNYVRLNVRDRDAEEFVAAAKEAVAASVQLPDGVHVEWTGRFEHTVRTQETLWIAIPVVIVLIVAILWWTYNDFADAIVILPAVFGAIAGGLLLQKAFGSPLSVGARIGYIACLGMAASTGIIMLVYLRQAVEAAGQEGLTPERLRAAVLDGAAKRLRPKFLTEAATLLSLAPLLLASGPGSEVLRPMVLPVLGGLLIADEVIDLFLPVLFYRIRLNRLQVCNRNITQSLAGGFK